MVESLKTVLMRRDGLTAEQAQEAINEAIGAVEEGNDPEDVLYDFFGLEPDYIFDILP